VIVAQYATKQDVILDRFHQRHRGRRGSTSQSQPQPQAAAAQDADAQGPSGGEADLGSAMEGDGYSADVHRSLSLCAPGTGTSGGWGAPHPGTSSGSSRSAWAGAAAPPGDPPHQEEVREVVSLGLWCMNPGLAFGGLASAAHSVVLASGTLAPLTSYAPELGAEFAVAHEGRHVVDVARQARDPGFVCGGGGGGGVRKVQQAIAQG
jgi:hypothetical protein